MRPEIIDYPNMIDKDINQPINGINQQKIKSSIETIENYCKMHNITIRLPLEDRNLNYDAHDALVMSCLESSEQNNCCIITAKQRSK